MRRSAVNVLLLAVIAAVLTLLVLPVIANGGRICFAPGAINAAVFAYPDRFEVYTIDGAGRGELQLSFTQTYLATLPAAPAENLLLGSSDVYTHVEMWRLAGGLVKVVAGPDGENKVHECIFGGSSARVRTYAYTGEALAASPGDISFESTGQPGTGEPTSVSPTNVPTEVIPPTPVDTPEVRFGG